MPTPLKLVVGLGNPGQTYAETRHNAGFWFVDNLAARHHGVFAPDAKFQGNVARPASASGDWRFLKPSTSMNNSGISVRATADYFAIKPAEILVVHDEIDLDPGTVRLKQGGGHGGHNGLRDIIEQAGFSDFLRLRIGVGHPGHKDDVICYVLQKPGSADKQLILDAIDRALDTMPLVQQGEVEKAMTRLHSGNRPRTDVVGEEKNS